MKPEKAQRLRVVSAWYFTIQALLVGAWWLMLAVIPPTRKWFLPEDMPVQALMGFWLPDVVLLVAGSLLAAWLLLRNRPRVVLLLWFVSGGLAYGTLYTAGVSILTGSGWIAFGCMLPAMLASLFFTVISMTVAGVEDVQSGP